MVPFNPPSPEALNAYFPNYEITAFIAQGGMGAVYLGKQLSLDRTVAIKILPPELGTDTSYFTLFESEAKSLAKVNHPNLVGIYDFGEVGGMFYIIMEYVPGRSLYKTSNGYAVDEHDAAYLIAEICKGLAHAHEFGILHRDIKPGNILINDEGHPKVVDFGLAKPVTQHNQSGVIYGTRGYTAPEVTKNPHIVDHRADIFSVGAMLYELLTGKLPGTPYVAPSQLNDTDQRFDHIVQRAMHPMPAMRYANCSEMVSDLENLINNWATQPRRSNGRATKILATGPFPNGAPTQPQPTQTITPVGVSTQPIGYNSGPRPTTMILGGYASRPTTAILNNNGYPTTPIGTPPGTIAMGRSTYVKPSSSGAGSMVGLIIALLVVVALICGGAMYFQNEKRNEAIRIQNQIAERDAKLEEEAKAAAIAAAEEKRKIEAKLAKEEAVRQKMVDKLERERVAEEQKIAALKKMEAEQAKLALLEEQRKKEEAERIAAEEAEAAITRNGPNAIEFAPLDYLKTIRAALLPSANKAKKVYQDDLARNIRELGGLADKEIAKLPNIPRQEAAEVVDSVMDDLRRLPELPPRAPEKANAAIIMHYTAALLKQDAIAEKLNKALSVDHSRYLDAIRTKIVELEKTENRIEIERLKLELEISSSVDAFRTKMFQ